jgi:hypothetical protein
MRVLQVRPCRFRRTLSDPSGSRIFFYPERRRGNVCQFCGSGEWRKCCVLPGNHVLDVARREANLGVRLLRILDRRILCRVLLFMNYACHLTNDLLQEDDRPFTRVLCSMPQGLHQI